MKIVCISDTHCQLDKVKVPKGDLLIHAGDLTFQGKHDEVLKELKIIGSLPHKHKVLICGNHDWLGEWNPELMKSLCTDLGITYLNEESVVIDSIKIYGAPHQPEFCNWAFNVPRGKELAKIWSKIPDDTNILVTHGPPYGILDVAPRGEHVGCVDLLARIHNLPDLTHHIFGHIHCEYGTRTIGQVTYVNASTCTEEYKPLNKPIKIIV